MDVDLFRTAQRYVGVREMPGYADHPFIQWCLMSCDTPPSTHDEVPWCSAFINRLAWELRLPRSKSASARSWLAVGSGVRLEDAVVGYDVVVLTRGGGEQPGPEVLAAPGHVGLYAGREGSSVLLLAGNQGNAVSVAAFPASRVLGVRRLA